MTVYHGSDSLIRQIDLTNSKPGKDFGREFSDYAIAEDKAIDLYFSSEIYRRLIDEDTELYRKPWSEVYQLLLDELKLKE